jgi:hypothetical protein
MIITKIQGGLGNQMFQYAIGAIMSLIKKDPLLLDISFFQMTEKRPGFTPRKFELTIFSNKYNIADKNQINKFKKLSYLNRIKKKINMNYPKLFVEVTMHFDQELLLMKSPLYLDGYFQSYKYFVGFEDFIRGLFRFPVKYIDVKNTKLLKDIITNNSISVHVRRGDYILDKNTHAFHGVCDVDYYLNAIKLIASQVDDLFLIFFSDDIVWAKEKFENLPYSLVFVDHNKGDKSWIDMFLMSNCKHNIIANSSFSWWGAFLNKSDEKIVIAPKEWFADPMKNSETIHLIPENWIRMN